MTTKLLDLLSGSGQAEPLTGTARFVASVICAALGLPLVVLTLGILLGVMP